MNKKIAAIVVFAVVAVVSFGIPYMPSIDLSWVGPVLRFIINHG